MSHVQQSAGFLHLLGKSVLYGKPTALGWRLAQPWKKSQEVIKQRRSEKEEVVVLFLMRIALLFLGIKMMVFKSPGM